MILSPAWQHQQQQIIRLMLQTSGPRPFSTDVMSHYPRLILLVVLVLFSMTAAYFTWRTHEALEGFDETEAQAVLADGGTAYERRIYIMKLFDVLLKRKATSAELQEFLVMDTDAEVLQAIMTQFNVAAPTKEQSNALVVNTDLPPPASATVPAPPPPPAPAPALPPPPVLATSKAPANVPAEAAQGVNPPKEVQSSSPGAGAGAGAGKGEIVCLDKEHVQRNIQDIMDHLAHFRSTISS